MGREKGGDSLYDSAIYRWNLHFETLLSHHNLFISLFQHITKCLNLMYHVQVDHISTNSAGREALVCRYKFTPDTYWNRFLAYGRSNKTHFEPVKGLIYPPLGLSEHQCSLKKHQMCFTNILFMENN